MAGEQMVTVIAVSDVISGCDGSVEGGDAIYAAIIAAPEKATVDFSGVIIDGTLILRSIGRLIAELSAEQFKSKVGIEGIASNQKHIFDSVVYKALRKKGYRKY